MSLTLRPVRVGNGSDEEGMLLFDGDQRLVAVLTHLSGDNEVDPEHWPVEASFGRLDGGSHLTFANVDMIQAWINERLATS
jgi:hypothetical protein